MITTKSQKDSQRARRERGSLKNSAKMAGFCVWYLASMGGMLYMVWVATPKLLNPTCRVQVFQVEGADHLVS